ncbi:MAG: DUF4065 domain-containing protein [Lachnospiraceae bacterium]|nr:DUF4065 domain-containing protein [Lachnospiraceae bacterium]
MSEEKTWVRAGEDFCTNCREVRPFYRKMEEETVEEEGEEPFTFLRTVTRCFVCDSEMETEGLVDLNTEEYLDARCEALGLIQRRDLCRLMELYEIGKAPLSLALGFGEITVTRWLAGCFPSKEYSDICKRALKDPSFMRKCLKENREKLTRVCFEKADRAAARLEKSASLSKELLAAVRETFRLMGEITPLALQKLLYFMQGLSYALLNAPFYPEDCEAWAHGPVVRPVYELLRDFCFDPTEDPRFSVLEGGEALAEDKQKILLLTLKGFGRYNPRVLELLTHRESPWRKAREGLLPGDPGYRYLRKEDIRECFLELNKQYDLSTTAGIRRYVEDALRDREGGS